MAAVGGVVLIASPEGMRSGIKKHMRLICSLCMLCVMIAPVGELVSALRDIGDRVKEPEGDGSLESIYESIYEENAESGYSMGIGETVKKLLNESFSVPEEECRVGVEFKDSDGDGFREPCKITVVLSGGSIFKNSRAIEDFISKSFRCDCVCAIE